MGWIIGRTVGKAYAGLDGGILSTSTRLRPMLLVGNQRTHLGHQLNF